MFVCLCVICPQQESKGEMQDVWWMSQKMVGEGAEAKVIFAKRRGAGEAILLLVNR